MSYHTSSITTHRLWVSDIEVRSIFGNTRCFYKHNNGFSVQEATGIFVREKRANDGTLGYVLRNPINGENWLWIIGKKDRRPFAVAKVS